MTLTLIIPQPNDSYATCVWFSTGVTLLSLFCAIPLIGKL